MEAPALKLKVDSSAFVVRVLAEELAKVKPSKDTYTSLHSCMKSSQTFAWWCQAVVDFVLIQTLLLLKCKSKHYYVKSLRSLPKSTIASRTDKRLAAFHGIERRRCLCPSVNSRADLLRKKATHLPIEMNLKY